MKKLYYEDIHRTEFQACVTECIYDEAKKMYKIAFDQTAFFPEEGGQTADKGTVTFLPPKASHPITLPLLDVHSKQQTIYHYLEQKIPVGCQILGNVDWEQRFDFMQQHSGEHIISGLVNRYYGLDNVGFHLSRREVTLDFNGVLTLEQLRTIETEANQAVWQNLPIQITYPTPKELQTMTYRSKLDLTENVRIVTIPGYDVCACCAPHTDTTGQIGIIKITNVQAHRGGVRINILCGSRALGDYTSKQDSVDGISRTLSVKPELVLEGTQRLKEENLLQKEQIYHLQTRLLHSMVSALPLPEDSPHALLFIPPMNDIAIRSFVNELTAKYAGYVGVFWGNDTNGYRYILGSSSLDCRVPATALKENFGAKGGGKAPMIQGTVMAAKDKILSVLNF